MNVTLPLGFCPVTLAVRVTACPAAEGLGMAVSAVLLPALFTVRLLAAEVLARLLASPL